MFKLFFTISLNPFEKGCKCHLLTLSQIPLLFKKFLMQILLILHPLLGFHGVSCLPVLFSFFVILH